MSRARRLARWLPALGLMTAIAWSSHQSEWPAPVRAYPDWLLHGLAFGALAGTVHFAQHADDRGRSWQIGGIAMLVASLYGVVDEVHQSFIVGRDANVMDWAADTAGAALVAVAATLSRPR